MSHTVQDLIRLHRKAFVEGEELDLATPSKGDLQAMYDNPAFRKLMNTMHEEGLGADQRLHTQGKDEHDKNVGLLNGILYFFTTLEAWDREATEEEAK